MAKKTAPPVSNTQSEKSATISMQAIYLSGLLGDFRLLLVLFIAFRFMLLLAYQPLVTQDAERGITVGGDFQTYYEIAGLSKTVGLPLRDWWSEFPPLWSYLSVAIYQLQGANPSYGTFASLLSILFLVADAGNLILIRKIGTQLYKPETGMALAWIYALLLAPLVFSFWTFEPLVVFMLLLGIRWLLRSQDVRSAVAVAAGALIKFTPALILGAVWRICSTRRALRYTIITFGIFILVYIPFFAQNAAMTLPSLTAQFNKASYESVWALIDGNFRTGNFGPLTDRLDPANAAVMQGNPPRVPGWLRFAIAAAVGLFVFVRTRRFDDKGLVAFVGITLLIFFLQTQGWSPQWVMEIIPFILLCFPTRNGVFAIILLSLATFLEYPFLFLHTGDTGGMITGVLVGPYAIIILLRTGILVGVCVGLYQILRQPREKSGIA